MKNASMLIIGLMAIVWVQSLQSQGVLFENGPISGTIGNRSFNNNFEVADSFTLASNSTVTSAMVGIWNVSGDSLVSLDWSITTAPLGGTTLATGNASIKSSTLHNTALGANYVWDVTADDFMITPTSLAAGTYWFQLSHGVTAEGNYAYWDMAYDYGSVNDVKSMAYQTSLGSIPSESFQLMGSTVPVPEPSTLVLAALSGFVLLLCGLHKNWGNQTSKMLANSLRFSEVPGVS